MKLKVSRVDVRAAEIEDRPGGLARKLSVLAEAGANLEFVIARRAPEKPGTGVVFVCPVKGAKRVAAATAAGFSTAGSMHSVRVEGPDRPGLGACMTQALADAGINMRGLSAASIGRKCVVYFAFDSDVDADAAIKVLRRL